MRFGNYKLQIKGSAGRITTYVLSTSCLEMLLRSVEVVFCCARERSNSLSIAMQILRRLFLHKELA